jgi:hypothetical protein
MSQDTLPEIQVATEALESRISITEAEVERMKDDIAGRRKLLRALRKALVTINPKRAGTKWTCPQN